MLKKVFSVVKKIVFYSFLLYGYNLIVKPLNVIIPINYFSIGALTIFGIPALFSLILIFILIY